MRYNVASAPGYSSQQSEVPVVLLVQELAELAAEVVWWWESPVAGWPGPGPAGPASGESPAGVSGTEPLRSVAAAATGPPAQNTQHNDQS